MQSNEKISTWANRAIPDNAALEIDHRRFCAQVYMQWVNQPLDAVYTSETYGSGFVSEINKIFEEETELPAKVLHRFVEIERKSVPISATQIRADPYANRQFLSPLVYASFVKRVCFLGAESTGKSTLTEALARKFNTHVAKEYGRDLWIERQGNLSFSDMILIAKTHIANEERVAADRFRYLFVDTSPLTTWLYSLHYFGKAEDELTLLTSRAYDLTFLCLADFPFVQDGTRISQEFRMQQQQAYLNELGKRNIPYIVLSGSLDERISQVEKALTNIL